MWWNVWWALALIITWASVPHLDASHAGRVWWSGWAGMACLLALSTSSRREWGSWRGSVVVGIGCVVEAWRLLSIQSVAHWNFLWGAWWDIAGWWLLVWVASGLIVRQAPSPKRWFPCLLFSLLCLQLMASGLEAFGWTRWLNQSALTGLLASQVAWAAICVIAWPLLWSWKKWAVLPAALGLLIAPTSSACLAWLVGWAWPRSRGRMRWGLACLTLLAIIWQEPNLRVCIEMRLDTWVACLKTLLSHPWGIGWGMNAYGMAAANSTVPILPHPASDWLLLPLRYGWWTFPVFVWASRRLWSGAVTPAVTSLRVAWWLAAWQTSVSISQVGMLVWLVWLLEQIRRTDGETDKVGT